MLKEKGSQSELYAADVNGVDVVLKKSKYDLNTYDKREFLIGTELNKLKHFVPNFMYTLGHVMTEEKFFIICERIVGNTFMEQISNMKFPQYLFLFLQILLALEIGQRNSRFCHFDLHLGNVLLRETRRLIYTVLIRNKKYTITTELVPMIIDFGMSSVTDKNRTIGTSHFHKHGILKHLIPGMDMYKFLFYSAFHCKDDKLKSN